jgi:hypothetical protein
MSLPKISVILPTVTGREDYLARAVSSYEMHSPGNYELDLVVETNHASCGLGWQAGWERCTGDYILFTCDDIVACTGWAAPAVEAVDLGFLPAPQVYAPNGEPQSLPSAGVVGQDWAEVHMSALPFASRAQMAKVVPLFTAHYFTDNWISWRGQRAGWPCRLRSDFAFIHWWAQHKRGAGVTEHERMYLDQRLFEEACRRADAGTWTEPWPRGGGVELRAATPAELRAS